MKAGSNKDNQRQADLLESLMTC